MNAVLELELLPWKVIEDAVEDLEIRDMAFKNCEAI